MNLEKLLKVEIMTIDEAINEYPNCLYYNKQWHMLAQNGDIDSIVNIGTDFFRCEMMDYAVTCWQYVIDLGKGPAEAYSNLGVCYYYGNGVIQDYKKAVQYYQKAAAKNHPFGMYNLAVACEHGNGTPKDLEKAIYFYRIAASHNIGMAYDALRRLGVGNDVVVNKDDFSIEGFIGDEYLRICSQIAEYEDEWSHCNNNNKMNVTFVPFIYNEELKKAIEFKDIIQLIDKAISMKPSAALYYAKGNMYRYNGDEDIAIECYKKSLELDTDDYQALCNLGVMFYNKEMDQLALNCFLKSAEIHPSSIVYRNLGNVYKVLGDFEKSEKFYQMALMVEDD